MRSEMAGTEAHIDEDGRIDFGGIIQGEEEGDHHNDEEKDELGQQEEEMDMKIIVVDDVVKRRMQYRRVGLSLAVVTLLSVGVFAILNDFAFRSSMGKKKHKDMDGDRHHNSAATPPLLLRAPTGSPSLSPTTTTTTTTNAGVSLDWMDKKQQLFDNNATSPPGDKDITITTVSPTTGTPTINPTTAAPTSVAPTTGAPSVAPTTESPTTENPTTGGSPPPTHSPTTITEMPTMANRSTPSPTTISTFTASQTTTTTKTSAPTVRATATPNEALNTASPTAGSLPPLNQTTITLLPTKSNASTSTPTFVSTPTSLPTKLTAAPTVRTTEAPSEALTTASPSTGNPLTRSPNIMEIVPTAAMANVSTPSPTSSSPTSSSPTTESPTATTTAAPTTVRKSTEAPSEAALSTVASPTPVGSLPTLISNILEVPTATTTPSPSTASPTTGTPTEETEDTEEEVHHDDDDDVVEVYILMGQSNMVGQGEVGNETTRQDDGTLQCAVHQKGLYPYLLETNSTNWTISSTIRNVHVTPYGWHNKFHLIKNEFLTIHNNDLIGPEYGIGHQLEQQQQQQQQLAAARGGKSTSRKKIMLLKSCAGNRGLGWDYLPPGSPQFNFSGKTYAGYKDSPEHWPQGHPKPHPINWYAGKQYDDDTKNAKIVLNQMAAKYFPGSNGNYNLKGFFWWQGDKDRYDMAYASRYELHLVRLIRQLRIDFDAPDAKFVLATLGQHNKDTIHEPDAEQEYEKEDLQIFNAMMAVDGTGKHIDYTSSALGGNINQTTKYPDFVGNVATVYTFPLSRGDMSEDHYGGNAETYMNVGEGMGKAMIELVYGV